MFPYDSAVRGDMKKRIMNNLHAEFKAKRRIRTAAEIRNIEEKVRKCWQELPEMRLLEAVNTNNTEEVEKLLKSGVDPNSTDFEKRSALHVAVSRGYAGIVELLLKYGADPNKRDMIQNTPLHLAACVHNMSIITMLINAKADVTCLDLHGRNPFQLASSKLKILQKGWREGAIEMIKLREELRQVVDLLLSTIRMRGIEEKMERLHHSDVDIDSLQMMKLSLNSVPDDHLDDQMSNLLEGIKNL